ncbi:Putative fluoride ion transporter CrcB [Paraconexibacter sp. AEG42_29]|uniref:Fluoride-specific ion channel FluC n=1 Tax=Paraconexibacter sp. AEG42_29 TaxID=2997339 RepID=A0AAU7B0J6_9ACTN
MFAGGVVGALARASLAEHWGHGGGDWPWATFLVNVVGAFVLGAVAVRFARGVPGDARPQAGSMCHHLPPADVVAHRVTPGVPRALLGTGFCGALTTFSTLQLELVSMLRDGHTGLAAGYGAASLAAGLAACWAGGRLVAPEAGR